MNISSNKTIKIIASISLITIAIGISVYIRLFPLHNFSSDEAHEKATLLVLSNIRKDIGLKVEAQSPNLPTIEKLKLTNQLFNNFIKSEKKKFNDSIEQLSKQLTKQIPSNRKTPYLLASDSFYYFKLTKNILHTGKISNKIKGSKYFNELMLAPLGFWEPLNLHPYVGFSVYKVISIFNKNVDLMHATSFTPIVISVLSLLAFVFICLQLNCNILVTFVGSLYFSLAQIFLKRSCYGWYDNDPYNVLFPTILIGLFFFALNSLKSDKILPKDSHSDAPKKVTLSRQQKKQFIVTAVIISITMMIYSMFWQGWMFIYGIFFISGIAFIFFNHFVFKQKVLWPILPMFLLIIYFGSFIAIGLVFGFGEFFVLIKEGWIALKNFLTPQLSLWPDIYISVGELHKSSLDYIITSTGGYIFFIIALLGFSISAVRILFSFIKYLPIRITGLTSNSDQNTVTTYNNNINNLILITASIFFMAAFVLALGAQRFAIFCLIPFSIFFVIGLQTTVKLILNKSIQLKQICKVSINIFVTISLLIIAILGVKSSNKEMPTLLNKIYNDTWDNALTKIKEKTPENSIINAWWPPGHFIKSTAERRVTFDGATINFPQSYWLANLFLAKTEQEAFGILRMINTSGNEAADYLHNNLGIKLSLTVQILKDITKLNRTDAAKLLKKVFKPYQTDKILSLTHDIKNPSYCLLYNEFVESNLQLKFIGNWNFQKIEQINDSPKLMSKIPKRNSKEYIDFLWNLVGGPSKFSEPLTVIGENENMILFNQGIALNSRTKDVIINSDKFGKGIPHSIVYLEGNDIKEKVFDNATLNYSLVLFADENNLKCILMDTVLAESMLVKLYYFNAAGLKYIKPIIEESDLTKRTVIKVFEIDWKSFNN